MNSPNLLEASRVLLVGVAATALLDIWQLALSWVFGLPRTNWAHVGRWVSGLRSGALQHTSIAAAPSVAYERTIGWATHYVIGVIYAALYLLVLAATSRSPDIVSAVIFGLVTVAAPWLILQPGLGAGYFASNTPKPNQTRALNLLSHLVFGIGLYVGWASTTLIVSLVARLRVR